MTALLTADDVGSQDWITATACQSGGRDYDIL